jgi:hypothetical protein
MVYLEPANNPQCKEQATILLLKCWLSESGPKGTAYGAVASPVLVRPSGRHTPVVAKFSEYYAFVLFSASPQPLSRIFFSWGLWCSCALNETTFPKSDELCSEKGNREGLRQLLLGLSC